MVIEQIKEKTKTKKMYEMIKKKQEAKSRKNSKDIEKIKQNEFRTNEKKYTQRIDCLNYFNGMSTYLGLFYV